MARVKITVVYDNCASEADLLTGWGFSCLVETEAAAPILFDTGADGATLLHNMRRLGIDPGCLGTIVISHGHADHTGGLPELLELNRDARICLPASVRDSVPGREVVAVSGPRQISENVLSTGELGGIEQSLAVKMAGGLVVLTGCSHPGVGAVLEAARQHGVVCGIMGGLHGFQGFDELKGLALIVPCHCTQHKEELARRFPEQHVRCGVGLRIDLT